MGNFRNLEVGSKNIVPKESWRSREPLNSTYGTSLFGYCWQPSPAKHWNARTELVSEQVAPYIRSRRSRPDRLHDIRGNRVLPGSMSFPFQRLRIMRPGIQRGLLQRAQASPERTGKTFPSVRRGLKAMVVRHSEHYLRPRIDDRQTRFPYSKSRSSRRYVLGPGQKVYLQRR